MISKCCVLKPVFCQKGFTLIETLVAVMILAISLVVVMQLFSGGLKSNRVSNDYLYGIFHAREKMEELLLIKDLQPGSLSGDFGDGYRWRAVIDFIDEFSEEEEAEVRKMPVASMNINLSIVWKTGSREKRYEIATTVLTERKAVEEVPE